MVWKADTSMDGSGGVSVEEKKAIAAVRQQEEEDDDSRYLLSFVAVE